MAIVALGATGVLAGGCAARAVVVPASFPITTVAESLPVPAVPVSAPAQQPDPAAELIALSNEHFENGERELQLGHLDTARGEFNRAIEVLLESPLGAREEPNVREHFDRLVERISAYEVTALAQGDGFAEKKYEPAGIDELLASPTFEVPAPTTETERRVAADLKTILHDIDIPLNGRVLSFVQLFTGRLKSFLEEGLSRSVQFLPMIQDVFRAEGLPLDLAYVPLVESAFKPSALSRAKAKGMWQFMRGTALENGLQHDWYIDERAEPEKATLAAAKYLKTLHKTFDGDWLLALASYNGGPGRVQRAIKRSRHTDFWKLTATSRYLPRETRDYVPLILAAIIIARNPAQYGMQIVPVDSPRYERVTLRDAVDLRRVAEWIGTPVQVIQELNPELRRWTTPIRATDYELKVPAGMAGMVQARLADTEPGDLAPLNWYTVRRGDTLRSVARKLKVSATDLAEANYRGVRSQVRAGERLVIPLAPTVLLAAKPDNPPPLTESRPVDAAAATSSMPRVQAREPDRLTYRVRRGDTLSSIARVYRTTVASLKASNRLRSNAIQVGQRLTIFTDRSITATN